MAHRRHELPPRDKTNPLGNCQKCGNILYPLANYPEYALCDCGYIQLIAQGKVKYHLISYCGWRCSRCQSVLYHETTINGQNYARSTKCTGCNYHSHHYSRKPIEASIFKIVSYDEALQAIAETDKLNKVNEKGERLKKLLLELSEITSEIAQQNNITLCRCGCGKPVPTNSRGRPRKFVNRSHRDRHYYDNNK